MKVVSVYWADAFIDTDDFTIEDGQETKPVYRTTVGYFIAKNQHGICLATDYYEDPEEGVAGKLFIPSGMILKIREYEICGAQSSEPCSERSPQRSLITT